MYVHDVGRLQVGYLFNCQVIFFASYLTTCTLIRSVVRCIPNRAHRYVDSLQERGKIYPSLYRRDINSTLPDHYCAAYKKGEKSRY